MRPWPRSLAIRRDVRWVRRWVLSDLRGMRGAVEDEIGR
jgi:hypothetical protein